MGDVPFGTSNIMDVGKKSHDWLTVGLRICVLEAMAVTAGATGTDKVQGRAGILSEPRHGDREVPP
jgi:hypothetical protein